MSTYVRGTYCLGDWLAVVTYIPVWSGDTGTEMGKGLYFFYFFYFYFENGEGETKRIFFYCAVLCCADVT